MKILVACLVCLFAATALAAAQKFGAPITLKEALPVGKALAEFDRLDGKAILLTGKVEKVCQQKGCWMELRSGDDAVRVTFKDYGFFVAKDLAGRTVRCEGQLERKVVSVEDQKHYLKDAGLTEAAAAVKAPKVEYHFVATGVETQG